jgi:hypothetical protein
MKRPSQTPSKGITSSNTPCGNGQFSIRRHIVTVEVDVASVDAVFIVVFPDGGLHAAGGRRQIGVGDGIALIEFDIAKATIDTVFVLMDMGHGRIYHHGPPSHWFVRQELPFLTFRKYKL